MTTYVRGRTGEPFAPEPAVAAAYQALRIAAERIGAGNWTAQLAAHRGRGLPRFAVTAAHRAVVDAMPAVLAGRMTPEAAMALLWTHDVMRERLAGPREERP